MPAVRSKRTKNIFKFFAVNKHRVTADAAVKFRMRKRAGETALGVDKAVKRHGIVADGQSSQIHIGYIKGKIKVLCRIHVAAQRSLGGKRLNITFGKAQAAVRRIIIASADFVYQKTFGTAVSQKQAAFNFRRRYRAHNAYFVINVARKFNTKRRSCHQWLSADAFGTYGYAYHRFGAADIHHAVNKVIPLFHGNAVIG